MVTVCAKVALRPRRVAETGFRVFKIYDGKKLGYVFQNPATETAHFNLKQKELYAQKMRNSMCMETHILTAVGL